MKTFIYFNAQDCLENIGQSQLTGDINSFLDERKNLIIDPIISSDRITFTKSVDENGAIKTGYALIFSVPDDFQN